MGKIEQKDKTVRNKAFEGIAGSRKKKKTCTFDLIRKFGRQKMVWLENRGNKHSSSPFLH